MIRVTAREFSARRPATIIHPGRRVNWYGDDTQRSRAIALLNALMGNWAARAACCAVRDQGPGYPCPISASDRRWPTPMATLSFADEPVTTGIREATISGKPIRSRAGSSTREHHERPANEAETLRRSRRSTCCRHRHRAERDRRLRRWVLPETVFLERHDELLTAGAVAAGWRCGSRFVARPRNRSPLGGSQRSWPASSAFRCCVQGHKSTSHTAREGASALQRWRRKASSRRQAAHHVEEGLELPSTHRPARSSSGPSNWRRRFRSGTQVHPAPAPPEGYMRW